MSMKILTPLAIGLLAAVVATPAATAGKVKSVQTEAKFVSYDAASKTITVRIVKPGRRPEQRDLKLARGKEAKFRIKPEGSVLTRTSVTIDAKRASIADIKEGNTLNIYWVPDEENPKARFARKIDLVLSDEELEARDKARLEAERAAGKVSEE